MIRFSEHALDVLAAWLEWERLDGAALVIVIGTEGGGVRAPGAMMSVSSTGARAGYISGGCLDADVARHAMAAITVGKPRRLRYGAGSPFVDLPLPCGGAIELMILPQVDAGVLRIFYDRLAARQPITLAFSASGKLLSEPGSCAEFTFRHMPKLRLRIAGRGADALALARLAQASGVETLLQMREPDRPADGGPYGSIIPLVSPGVLPPLADDPWTALVLAFHDHDWEDSLLAQALTGPAFFIGAVGSRRTHSRRCERLRAAGIGEEKIARVRGPVGLLPSMRDASMLALSILAELAVAWQEKQGSPFRSTALILLAAGQSSRFEGGDKLMAPYRGRRLIDHSAGLLHRETVATRIAVVAPDQVARAEALHAAGWTVTVCPDAASGQAASLAAGIREAARCENAEAAMVLLADMPDVSEPHLFAVREALTPSRTAVVSQAGTTLLPPAAFSRSVFARLSALTGDVGARQIIGDIADTATVPMAPSHALDIDTQDDLVRANGRAAEARA